MFNLQTTSTTMELLPLVCLYILAWSARGDQTDPPVYKTVMEGDNVVLPCSFGNMDITNKAFDWKKENGAHDKKEVFLYERGNIYDSPLTGQAKQFKGRVFHFSDQLTSGNASIQIKPTKVDDSGTYICIKADTPPTILSIVQLTVGAAKKPYVTTLEHTKDRALLECEVLGASPKPNVTWQDRAGNIIPAEEPQITERENRYDIILQTTVTKTDYYRCVATQEEINHQTYSETHIRMDGTNAVTLEALEGSNIILPCSTSTKEDMVSGLFDWKKDDGAEVFLYDAGRHYNNGRPGQDERFRGRVSHFPDQLKVGKASIVIHNTKVNDSGSYRCIFPRLQPPEEKIITLVVYESSSGLAIRVTVAAMIPSVVYLIFVLA